MLKLKRDGCCIRNRISRILFTGKRGFSKIRIQQGKTGTSRIPTLENGRSAGIKSQLFRITETVVFVSRGLLIRKLDGKSLHILGQEFKEFLLEAVEHLPLGFHFAPELQVPLHKGSVH